MALLELKLRPSERDLRWFGLIMLLFFGLLATVVWWKSGATGVPGVLVTTGAALCCVYYLVPPLRRLLYVGWMRAVFPIGWVVSHALIGLVYYGILTPVGWALRLSGHDPMHRKLLRNAQTYWVERRDGEEPARYFRQF
jgi:hypothetical protein